MSRCVSAETSAAATPICSRIDRASSDRDSFR